MITDLLKSEIKYHIKDVLMLQRLKTLLKKDVWEVILPGHQDEESVARYRQRLNEIEALPFDEARRRAEHLLIGPQKFKCSAASESSDTLAPLAPGLQSLFSRYRRIEVIQSDAVLDRDAASPFSSFWYKGFWQIGTDLWDDAILVKPYQEGIYDAGNSDGYLTPDHASVYHWLLTEAATASDRVP